MDADGEGETASEPVAMGPRRLVIREADIVATLHRLQHLRDRTDPRCGERGEVDKDFHARAALLLAGGSLWPLIEWAVHHEAGRCARGVEAAPVPPAGHRDNPAYLAAAEAANSHANEMEGRRFAAVDDRHPAATRAAVAWVLRTLLRNWPPAQDVADELEGLNRGERPRILAAPRNLRDRDKALWKLRRLAVQHVHFRAANGATVDAARAHVAAALGVEGGTLRQWEARLPKMFGAIVAHDARARAAATRAALAEMHPDAFAQAWGMDALADAEPDCAEPAADADDEIWRLAGDAEAVRVFGEKKLARLAAEYERMTKKGAKASRDAATAQRKATKRRAA